MKIFYFSGTGNSFYAAKVLSGRFPGADITSIGISRNENIERIADDELVIVCPVYFYGIPNIVREFLNKIIFDNVSYFSVVFTAEYPNGRAINELKTICKKRGLRVNSCFYLQMPTNYLIKSSMLSSDKIEHVLNKAEKKLNQIINIIQQHKEFFEKDSKIYSFIVGAENKRSYWENAFTEFDAKFTSNENCNQCTLCATSCPVGNIDVKKKPVWKNKCEACLKCISICPKQAIQYDNKTEGRIRYFNPKVGLNEFH